MVFLYGSAEHVSQAHQIGDSGWHIQEVAADVNGWRGFVRARFNPSICGVAMVRSVAAALRLPTRPLGGGGGESLMGGSYPLELVAAPVAMTLFRGPGAPALVFNAPLVFVVADENKCTDWEVQLGTSFNEAYSITYKQDGLAFRRAKGPEAPPAEVPFIAPRLGREILYGTSTFIVARDTLALAVSAASEAAAAAARARASGGTAFFGSDACAQCGAARGAPGVRLQQCGGCSGVLQVTYCGVSGAGVCSRGCMTGAAAWYPIAASVFGG